jgi:hypothetical protein
MAGKPDEPSTRSLKVPPDVDYDDLADDVQGRNSLQGNDQRSVRNQRQAVPGVKRETEGVIESFEKTEQHDQARRDAANRKPDPDG